LLIAEALRCERPQGRPGSQSHEMLDPARLLQTARSSLVGEVCAKCPWPMRLTSGLEAPQKKTKAGAPEHDCTDHSETKRHGVGGCEIRQPKLRADALG